jgi:hypothetical protein
LVAWWRISDDAAADGHVVSGGASADEDPHELAEVLLLALASLPVGQNARSLPLLLLLFFLLLVFVAKGGFGALFRRVLFFLFLLALGSCRPRGVVTGCPFVVAPRANGLVRPLLLIDQ